MAKKKTTKTKASVKPMADTFSFGELQKELLKVNPNTKLMNETPFENISDWFSTGNLLLNAQISGSMFKGIAAGRVTTLAGGPGSGKTFIALNAAREAQKKGYYIQWIDTENAMDRSIMQRFGIDASLEKVDLHPVNTVESATNIIYKLVETLKKQKTGYKVGNKQYAPKEIPKILIVIDSIGNLVTERTIKDAADGETKSDMGYKEKLLKRLFSLCMVELGLLQIPLIVVGHVYGSQFSSHGMKVAGGFGPFFNASTVIKFSTSKLKDGKTKTGIIVNSEIEKSRFCKAGIDIQFHISFYKGMNPYVGLEQEVDWEHDGIAVGKLKDGDFTPLSQKTSYAIKHLNKAIKPSQLWTPVVWTDEVLQNLDKKLQEKFELPDSTTADIYEIDDLLGIDESNDNENEYEDEYEG